MRMVSCTSLKMEARPGHPDRWGSPPRVLWASVAEPFVNETPQAAVRFIDADHGLVVLGLSGKTSMIALRTADGGKTWKEESLPARLGTPYISRDGKFLAVNKWNDGVILLKHK